MRAELSRQCGWYNVVESTKKRAENGWRGGREERGCQGRRGLYVKGGRARCYLACSPDEISASSFRPSSPPLLPRSFPPSLPSSYAFFLFCPLMLSRLPDSLWCSCEAKSFSARAIVRLLIALGFLSISLSFSSRFLFFLFKFIFSSAAFPPPHPFVFFVHLFSDFLFFFFFFFLAPWFLSAADFNPFSSHVFCYFLSRAYFLIIFLYLNSFFSSLFSLSSRIICAHVS